MKILVAMSGGVDSSVSAYLLKRQGYTVAGLSFILRDNTEHPAGYQDASSKENADALGIEHFTVDLRKIFKQTVVDHFINGYINGLTPNPCVHCNKNIKFPLLLQEARARGFERIATGHYARLSETNILGKAIDLKKDQSYFLYVLNADILKHALFPCGDYLKEDIKEIARKLSLPAALKPESQDICFVDDGNYRHLIALKNAKGPVKTLDGKVVGEHTGVFNYTLGQRKGLGIAFGVPMYVIRIDTDENTIIVGPRNYAMIKEINVKELNILDKEYLLKNETCMVKFRSTMKEVRAKLVVDDDKIKIQFMTPQWAPACGQSAVFYSIEGEVLGGGIIE